MQHANPRALAIARGGRRVPQPGPPRGGARRRMPPRVELQRPRRQPVVPAQAGHSLRLHRGQGRQAVARRRHGHAPDEDDRRRALRRRPRPPLPARPARRSARPTGTARTRAATSGTSARTPPSSTRTVTSRAPRAPGWPASTARRPASSCPAHPQRRPDRAAGVPTRATRKTTSRSSASSAPSRRPARANALLTKEWTPLEPGVIDHKMYVRGDRHRPRADPEGRQRAQRAHRGDPELTRSLTRV